MLLNNFYKIKEITCGSNELNGQILINAEHEIFKGHFPNQPIVPGVCMIHIIKEILEHNWDTKLLLIEGKQIKFLKLIDPKLTPELSFFINWEKMENQYDIIANFKDGAFPVLKFQGMYHK